MSDIWAPTQLDDRVQASVKEYARFIAIEKAAKRHLRENSAESWRELNKAVGPEKVRGRAD